MLIQFKCFLDTIARSTITMAVNSALTLLPELPPSFALSFYSSLSDAELSEQFIMITIVGDFLARTSLMGDHSC